jgi:hypothetical protein
LVATPRRKHRKNISRCWYKQYVFGYDPQALETKANEITSSWKASAQQRNNINGLKRKPTEWGKILANYPSDKRLISRIYKELRKLLNKYVIN